MSRKPKPPPLPASIQGRIRRAKQLSNEVKEWAQRPELMDQATLESEHDPKEGISSLVFRLPPAPEEIGLLVSDLVHQLRSALDNSVWAVMESQGVNHAGMHRLEFPIFDEAEKYPSDKRGAKLKGANDAFAETVYGLQPFNKKSRLPQAFWHLHRLNNRDKHRVLLPTVGKVVTPLMAPQVAISSSEAVENWRLILSTNVGRRADGATLFAMQTDPKSAVITFNTDVITLTEIGLEFVLDTDPDFYIADFPMLIEDVRVACVAMCAHIETRSPKTSAV